MFLRFRELMIVQQNRMNFNFCAFNGTVYFIYPYFGVEGKQLWLLDD